jgi:predicted unusual protein kinase regulating ubiquinone biosynthesis (AarF/ABC1/UbiB family)
VHKSQTDTQRQHAKRALASLLEDARGIPMKVAQLLASADAKDPLSRVVRGIRPWPLDELLPSIRAALGRPIEDVFEQIDPDGHAASLGQVHRAVRVGGREVAIKVQYPDIAAHVSTELRLAGLVPGLGPVRKWGFDLDGYKQVLQANMESELDYEREAERQVRFFRDVTTKGLIVPNVHEDLRSPGLLVQDWEPGCLLDEVRTWDRRARLETGRILLETLLRSLFRAGLVHGDPHPGNFHHRLTPESGAEVVLLDFGCTVDVSTKARLALLRLILARRGEANADTLACFCAMGFSRSRLLPISDALDDVADILLEPFLTESVFDASEWQLGSRIGARLGELKWWFRAAGPPELLLLMRAFQGLVRQLEVLDARLPWYAVLRRSLDEDLMDAARSLLLESSTDDASQAPEGRARLLKVLVAQGNVAVIDLAMPAREALDLRRIIPGDVALRIKGKGLDLQETEERLRAGGLSPQTLISLHDGPKHYRVWLE